MTHLTYPYMVASDIHFHSWTFGSHINTEGVNSRLQDIIDEFVRAASVLKEQGGKCIVITGDMFHTRGEIKPSVYNPVYNMFQGLSEEGFVIFVIPGNHDLEDAETTVRGNCFASFAAIPNFNIIYGFCSYPIGTLANGEWAYFIPWTEDFETELFVSSARINPARVTLFAHAGLTNVVTGVKATITPEKIHQSIKGLKHAFFGHFHNHKRFDVDDGFRQSTIYSVGATTHQSFKDVDSKAGFLIVTETEVIHHETQAPKFVDYTYDDWVNPTGVDRYKFVNNYVRILLEHASLKSDEVVAIKVTIETVGALKVINRTTIDDRIGGTVATGHPITYTLGETEKINLGAEINKYVSARFDKTMANAMLDIIAREGIDEE